MEENKIRKVYLDELPHSKSGKQILWRECSGKSFNFDYDGLKGKIDIIDYDKETQSITLKYNNKEYKTKTSYILQCKIAFVLGLKTREYKYDIGDIVKFNTGDIKITKLLRNNKGKRYEYKCLNCEQISEIQESMIGITTNCPICCNNPQRIIKGVNDISTTNSWIIKYLANKEDAYKYGYGSNKKIKFRCPDCGSEKEMKISQFISQGFSCPRCGEGFSMGNKIMFNVLTQLDIEFKSEYSPNWCKYNYKDKIRQGIYDFYIPSKKLVIEMDGKQHKKEGNIFKINLKDQQFIDKEKDLLANQNGLKIIRIDCEYTDLTFIKNNIFNSGLVNVLNLSKINWIDVFDNTISSRVKECCYKFNNDNMNVSNLSQHYKVSNVTIINWLKQGTKLGWCNYDGNEERRKSYINKKTTNKAIEILKNDKSLGRFESYTELEQKSEKLFGVKLIVSGISQMLHGNTLRYKGFTFKYI